ncbi:MAG: Abi family protein [Oscillospiraceae bacterium]|nr:Abi family protein [Oscillospiraceae bacterium]
MKDTSRFIEADSLKSPATISEQVRKLQERRMLIADTQKAYETLETINYYRLIHYSAVFLEENGQHYKEGTRFEDTIRIYDFDRKLRNVILVALEEIEIAVRAAISNYHAVRYGAVGYRNGDSFDRRHNHRAFMSKIGHMISKNANLVFVRHYNDKHKGEFPLWVMMEMFSFGMLVFFYQDLKIADKRAISDYYFNLDHRIIENWLQGLADLRNHCAHYNRLYANPLSRELKPLEITQPREYEMGDKLFDYLLVIKTLHKNADTREKWTKSFVAVMEALFDEYSDITQPDVLGFPSDWKDFLC